MGKPNYCPKIHFNVDFSSFPPKIKIRNHSALVEEKTQELNEMSREESYESYVSKVFETVNGCDFVIFESNKVEFIQYWIGNNDCWFDFPMVEYNGNESNLTKIISLLKKLEFKEQKKGGAKLECYKYCLSKSSELFSLNANFGRDKEKVINFTSQVLKNIFKVPLEKIEIMVG